MANQIYFIGNAGVIVQIRGITVMIDGLYRGSKKEYPVSQIPPHLYKDLIDVRRNSLPKPDYILFSHNHKDHFSETMLEQYLESHTPRKVFLPNASRGTKRHICHPAKNVEIQFLRTRHLGKIFQDVIHNCILLKIHGISLLFTSDVDFFSESLEELKYEEISGIFVNPLFFHSEKGQKILKQWEHPFQIFVYHVPFLKDDRYYMQSMVRKDMEQYQLQERTVLLCESNQIEELPE